MISASIGLGTKVFATLATIPGREDQVTRAIASLLPQVDVLHVHRNGFEEAFCSVLRGRLTFTTSETNLGDQMKFLAAPQEAGWHFACDDDLIYPPDYVESMIAAAVAAGGPVSAHGSTLRQPFKSYYHSRVSYHFGSQVHPTMVDVLGTGVCLYHSDHAPSGFESPNMADIWAAISWKRQGLKLHVVGHERDWIKSADPGNTDTIWHASQREDGSFLDTGAAQTAAIKAHAELFFGVSH